MSTRNWTLETPSARKSLAPTAASEPPMVGAVTGPWQAATISPAASVAAVSIGREETPMDKMSPRSL
jgi:hypothetical protein